MRQLHVNADCKVLCTVLCIRLLVSATLSDMCMGKVNQWPFHICRPPLERPPSPLSFHLPPPALSLTLIAAALS